MPDLHQHEFDLAPLRCSCALRGRRAFTGLLLAGAAAPALAQIPECKRSWAAGVVSAESVESSAGQQYHQLLRQASDKRALAPKDHPQVVRLRTIAQRMIPFAPECNDRSRQWKWEVNLLGSEQVNAFCMPGGKIAFFYGILAKLQLSDDEVAFIMGHEISHALLEHAREQMGKNTGTSLLLRGGAALLGLGTIGDLAAQAGSSVLAKAYSRTDETEADRLGMLMSARGGYDPGAGVTLWQKMMAGSGGGAPPAWLSTHPSNEERIAEIEKRLPRVVPMFEAAEKPSKVFGPPPKPDPKAAAKPKSPR